MKRLHRTTLSARAGLVAAALMTVAACGDGSDDATTAGDNPPGASSPVSPSPAATATTTPSPATTPSEQPTDSGPSPSAPTTSVPPATDQPRLIAYAGGESIGVQVGNRKQAARLDGAPADFKAFVGTIAQRLHDQTTCATGAVGVTVEAVRSDGYAVGGVNECGGYAALWAEVDGAWKEIAGTQDEWDCAVLEQYQVPSDIAGDSCYYYDSADHSEHKYDQA